MIETKMKRHKNEKTQKCACGAGAKSVGGLWDGESPGGSEGQQLRGSSRL